MRRLISFLLSCAFIAPSLAISATAQTYDAKFFGGLHWRLVGPHRGGRALAVTGIPGDNRTFYFGAVGGGVWRTDNAGRTWNPVFDSQPVASIGAIAIAPSDPKVVYVGSGEADMRSDIQQGNGMYKSSDGGKTWSHIGLEDTRQIGKILVDPRDANVVYVAALGHQYGPNAQRGVFKSSDGGKTWSKVLYQGEDTGAIDLAMAASQPNVIYASLWQTRRPPWNVYPPSNGPGSGLWRSTDAGQTWHEISWQRQGLPAHVGHVGISISPADPKRIYAFVDTDNLATGGIYRSDDSGATWTRATGEARVWKRGWYFGGITADPKDRDTVYVMNTSSYKSTDGGKTFVAFKGAPGGDDYHTMWIDPTDNARMILGSDQGTVITVDGGKTWSSWYNQPTGQFYHVSVDKRFPYWLYGAQQDSGSIAIPSRTAHTGISMHDWRAMDAGGESGTIAPDPLHPGYVYGSTVSHEQLETAWEQTVDPILTHPDTIWRNTWTLPIAASPTNPRVLYYSRQQIFRSENGGQSWTIISPDLTRPANTVPPNLDPATVNDSTGLARRGVVYWLAPSPVRNHMLWAGTDDGLIWVTRDEGKHWNNVTPKALTPWSKVGIIDASHFDSATAYAAIDRHRLDDNRPYIYRTHDGGAHWTAITGGIAQGHFVNVVREDPKRRGLLYAGTDFGIYVSFDDGNNWQSLQLNLPVASVRDIAFAGNDVVVATHGRSFWILDDASPLRQLSAQIARSRSHLFKPAPAYRFVRAGGIDGPYDEGTPIPMDEAQGENPAYGAYFDYYLANAATADITLSDAHGNVVRHWSSSDKPPVVDEKAHDYPAAWVHVPQPPSGAQGAHRFVWNLAYGQYGAGTIAAPPGTYSVTLRAAGTAQTQRFELLRDPRIHASNADLQRQFELARSIAQEYARVQDGLERAKSLLASHSTDARLKALVGAPPKETPDDSVGKPAQDFSSLRYVGEALKTLLGAVESADAAPAPDHLKAYAILRAKAEGALAKLRAMK